MMSASSEKMLAKRAMCTWPHHQVHVYATALHSRRFIQTVQTEFPHLVHVATFSVPQSTMPVVTAKNLHRASGLLSTKSPRDTLCA